MSESESPVFSQEADGIVDAEWLELVRRTGGNDSQFFTENQLYLEYARGRVQVTRYIARRGGIGLFCIVLGLGAWMYALHAERGLTMVVGIIVTLSGVGMVGTGVVTRRDPVPQSLVRGWLEKWLEHAPLTKLLREPSLAGGGARLVPPQIDRLIIVERELLADLLLMNGAHESLSALIVTESGYPKALLAEAQQRLATGSVLPVIALHDATPSGSQMAARLAASSVFSLKNRAIQDVGLFPADVQQIAELVPAIPPAYSLHVPLDFLSLQTLLGALGRVSTGALSLSVAIAEAELAATVRATPDSAEGPSAGAPVPDAPSATP